MIENRGEWEQAVKAVGRMYELRDRAKADSPDGSGPREDEIASVVMMIRKIEREIHEFLQAHPFTDDDYPELKEAAPRPSTGRNGAGVVTVSDKQTVGV